MPARRIAIVAGLVGGVGWLAKMVVMAAQGGPDPDSMAESVAFVAGLVGVLVATAAAAVHLTRERPPWFRAGAAIAALVTLVLLSLVLQTALSALPGDSWIQAEAVFGIIGLAALASALALARARRDAGPDALADRE